LNIFNPRISANIGYTRQKEKRTGGLKKPGKAQKHAKKPVGFSLKIDYNLGLA